MITYEKALAAGRKTGASKADDVQLMAMLLDSTARLLLGAVSPKLIFEGAQKKGMSSQELMKLVNDDPVAASELMWE